MALITGRYQRWLSHTHELISHPYEIVLVVMSYRWDSKSSVWDSTIPVIVSYGWVINSSAYNRDDILYATLMKYQQLLWHRDQLLTRPYEIVSILSYAEELLSQAYEITRGWKNIVDNGSHLMVIIRWTTQILHIHLTNGELSTHMYEPPRY